MSCIVSFRPHKLVHKKAVDGAYDANGDWVPGSIKCYGPVPCRFEPNGAAQKILLPDGSDYQYHYIVYLSLDDCLSPQYGDKVELFGQCGKSIGEFEVKGFHRFQLGLRIWV